MNSCNDHPINKGVLSTTVNDPKCASNHHPTHHATEALPHVGHQSPHICAQRRSHSHELCCCAVIQKLPLGSSTDEKFGQVDALGLGTVLSVERSRVGLQPRGEGCNIPGCGGGGGVDAGGAWHAFVCGLGVGGGEGGRGAVLRASLLAAASHVPLRCWVAGCAGGGQPAGRVGGSAGSFVMAHRQGWMAARRVGCIALLSELSFEMQPRVPWIGWQRDVPWRASAHHGMYMLGCRGLQHSGIARHLVAQWIVQYGW